MSDSGSSFRHPSGDRVLSSLANLEGPISELARLFPGASLLSGNEWLNVYFDARIKLHLDNPTYEYKGASIPKSFYDSLASGGIVEKNVVLRAIHPHFFRGFRDLRQPILINEKLVVIDGRNSSGKTSLAESVEWLFTGRLARRESMEFGNPKELESCIGNGFRPLTEQTWVEASFLVDGGDELKLRRVLTSDYGDTANSLCSSILLCNGKQITQDEEAKLSDELFGSVPPLLMQHTLRTFVQSTPANRHKYFERLLQLDELTTLVEKAAVGEKSLQEFHTPAGDVGLQLWNNIKSACKINASKSALRKAEKGNIEEIRKKINTALMQIILYEFPEISAVASDIQDAYHLIINSLSEKREESFPLLRSLRPRQSIDDVTKEAFSRCASLDATLSQLEEAIRKFDYAREAARQIDNAKIAISKALILLEEAKTLDLLKKSQICPLCNYADFDTLDETRIREIASWLPTISALDDARESVNSVLDDLKKEFLRIEKIGALLIPTNPEDSEWDASTNESSDSLKPLVGTLRDTLRRANDALREAITDSAFIKDLDYELKVEQLVDVKKNLERAGISHMAVLKLAEEYSILFNRLDQTVGSMAKENSAYNLQSLWISCVTEQEAILKDLLWEQAKKAAHKELSLIREELISIRHQLLETKRNSFSSSMTEIWQSLRCDSYSTFSKLLIPESHGKGFPIEIEVKAQIDDGNRVQEVDVLKVFSESQVNALAIAAFVTRSRMIGHKMLIFDDPVQSMDEEHFKTFAATVISGLLRSGFQIIIMTHNDTFARGVSYAHHDLDSYLTMSIRHSRKEGCQVEEGSRRVSERLKKAERQAEEGNLEAAWRTVRLAIERLYTVVYIKYGPHNFNPLSWMDQTAEYMWDDGSGRGAGAIIEEKIPGIGKRLKEILDMTAAGAHDKAPNGLTDLLNSTKELKTLLGRLQIGG